MSSVISNISKKLILNNNLNTKSSSKNDLNGSRLSNYRPKTRYAVDSIYTNPEVTLEGQQNLSEKLHNEISKEKELLEIFKKRQPNKKKVSSNPEGAKVFNDYCISFLENSKYTKENVLNTIDDAEKRIFFLKDLHSHLEEVERNTYRFEMNLPDQPIITKSMKDNLLILNEEENLLT